jgi:hypothetical protein
LDTWTEKQEEHIKKKLGERIQRFIWYKFKDWTSAKSWGAVLQTWLESPLKYTSQQTTQVESTKSGDTNRFNKWARSVRHACG